MNDASPGEGWAIRLHRGFEAVYWVVMVNALWWLFTLLGAVIVGMAPATVAGAELTRRRLRGELFPVLRSYASVWRREIARANLLLAPVQIAGAVLLVNAAWFASRGELSGLPGLLTMTAFAGVFAIGSITVGLYVGYDLPIRACILTAARWSLRNLPHAGLLIVALVVVVAATRLLPGLLPFVTAGALVTSTSALCTAFFAANERLLAEQQSPAGSTAAP